jgi:ferredoxin
MVMQARPAHVHDQGLAKDDARWVKQTVTVANRTYALLITAVAECPKQALSLGRADVHTHGRYV